MQSGDYTDYRPTDVPREGDSMYLQYSRTLIFTEQAYLVTQMRIQIAALMKSECLMQY